MRNAIQILSVIILLFAVISCGHSDKKSAPEDKARTTRKKELNKFEKRVAVLKTIEPVVYEDLKAWFPKQLDGLPLTETKPFYPMFDGQINVQATYGKLTDEKSSTLTLMDAAGPKGSSFATEIEEHQEKLPDLNAKGMEYNYAVEVRDWYARQVYAKDKKITQISFFHDDRMFIKLMSKGYTLEESWDLIGDLDFKALSKLITE